MVKIRLMRVGKKKQPSYRVVVADSRSPRDGRIIEAIGYYHPRAEPSVVSIDPERAVHWLQQGAQPSDQTRKLLEISGVWAAFRGEAPMPERYVPGPREEPAGETKPARARAPKKVTAAASVVADEAPDEAEEQAAAAPEAETVAEVPHEDATAEGNENANVE